VPRLRPGRLRATPGRRGGLGDDPVTPRQVLKAEPPEPLTVEQKKAKAPPARQDEPEEPPPHSGQREDKATKDTTPSSPPTLTAKDLQPKKPEVKGEPPSKAK
jgi:hypothetical protein